MLQEAARVSEFQVRAEIRKLEAGFQALQAKVSKVEALLGLRGSQPGRHDAVTQLLSEVEQRWDEEIKMVKRELHQTIVAHNHNADVMADHKSAIDKIEAEIEQCGPPEPERGVPLQEPLIRLSQTLELSRSTEDDVDALVRRSDALMQQVAVLGIIPSMSVGAAHASMQQYGHPFPVHLGVANMVA